MKKFKIIAQQTPFSLTSPIVLLIEENCNTNAYIESYKQLTKLGYNVRSYLSEGEAKEIGVDRDFIKESLPVEYFTPKMVHIRNIQELPY